MIGGFAERHRNRMSNLSKQGNQKTGTGLFRRIGKVRWTLFLYDALMYAAVSAVLLYIYPSNVTDISGLQLFLMALVGLVCVYAGRCVVGVYRQIWRYGNVTTYMRLIVADALAGMLFLAFRATNVLPRLTFPRVLSLFTSNLLLALSARVLYQYFYLTGNRTAPFYRICRKIIRTQT